MAVTTSQQIARYYTQYQTAELTFTKEVTAVMGLIPKQVHIKCLGYHWPCIIYSSSMVGAKIIANVPPSLKDALAKAKNVIQLRFAFTIEDKQDPLALFVGARVTGQSSYGEQGGALNLLALQYSQRPPDDLIERLGRVLESGTFYQQRRDERIALTPETIKRLRMVPHGTRISVDNVPRKGLLRDISLGGAKVLMHGVPQFLINRSIVLTVQFEDPEETIHVPGTIVRFEPVQDRTDIAAFAIQFSEADVAVAFKVRISDVLRLIKPKSAS